MKTRIILLGPPASGKGTQAELIRAHYGIPSASPGAMLREEMRAGTPLGREADELTRDGSMVPDAMVIQLVSNWLTPHAQSFIFDGFPRTIAQAIALEKILSDLHSGLDAVFFFDVAMETIVERVMHRLTCSQCGRTFAPGLHLGADLTACPKCGGALIRRSDDTPEALERRIKEYHEKTEPLVEYYQNKGLLWRLKSTDLPEGVFTEITSILEAV